MNYELINECYRIIIRPENQLSFMVISWTGFMPAAMDFVNSVYGPEAQQREKRHAEHSWAYPPILERGHILAEHFLSSEIGKKVMNTVGAEKIIKIFADETGKFSYDKFVQLMENHSFRRHWIHLVTLRMGKFIEYYSNSKAYEQYLTTTQFMINGFLSSVGYPKSALFDADKPVESSAALTDYVSERYLGTKIQSRQYIEPVYSYLKKLYSLIKEQSLVRGGTEGISSKLADSINLEIIEPIARVNRAYRYLRKNKQCDKYVLCLINQKDPNPVTLPGLKMVLSKGTSMVASLALSTVSEGSVMEYINLIMYEEDCQKYFKSDCSDYHEGETKVTTEYVHNEL